MGSGQEVWGEDHPGQGRQRLRGKDGRGLAYSLITNITKRQGKFALNCHLLLHGLDHFSLSRPISVTVGQQSQAYESSQLAMGYKQANGWNAYFEARPRHPWPFQNRPPL